MSSWTDTPHGFNPYIKTLPVDAYTSVGMYKEEQLKEGINKVQQYVDSIAGLPIDKEATRQYVQGKLGEIKKGLGENISGDFSDQRLVSQIGGAVSKIASDPVVINGMAGTASIRAGAAAIAEAKKTGKGYGVQNEAKFNELASQWQSDGDPTTKFNGSYTPYVDVIGRAIELYAKQNPGQNLPEGAFRYNSQGKVEVNPVLMEGVSAGRIKSVLNMVYQQPDVQQQLGIDGWYNYNGLSQKDLSGTLTKSTNSSLDDINTTIKNLQIKLVTDANVSSSDITKQIEELKEHAEDIKKQYSEDENLLTSNPDAFRAKLVRDGITSNFINAYSTQVMKKSPLWETQMDVAKYELDLAKEARRTDEWQKTFDYNREKDTLDFQLRSSKSKTGEDVNVVTTVGNISEQAGKLGETTFNQLVKDKLNNLSQGTMELVFKVLNNSDIPQGSFNPIALIPGGGYKFNVDPTGKSGYKTMDEAKTEYSRIYTEGRAQTMGGNPKPSLIAAYKELDPLIRTARFYEQTQKELESQKTDLVNTLKSSTGVSNPDYVDAYIVNKKLSGWENSEKKLKQKYEKQIEAGGYKVKQTWEEGLGVDKGNAGDIGADYEGKNYKEYKKFEKSFDQNLAPRFQELEEKFKSRQMAYNPLVSSVEAAKPEDKEIYRTKFSNIATAVTEGNFSNKPFRELLAEDKPGEYKTNIYGGYQDPLNKKYYLTVKRGKGQPEKLEVKKEEFESIPGFNTTNSFWNKFGDDLSLTGGATTDIPIDGKPGGINTAYILDRPNTSKYDVRYHVTNSGGNYNLKLYVKDKSDGHIIMGPVNAGLSATMDGIMIALEQLKNDTLIEGLINQNK